MRIAVIGSRGYPYVYSGYETFVRELSERLVRQGMGVTVYCRRNLFRERPKEVNGVRLVYLPTIERKSLSQFFHSFQSVLHACFCRHDLLLVVNSANGPLGLLTRLFRKRTVINVDGLEWLRPKWRGLGARYFRWASRLSTRLYDRVVTDSLEMQKVYRQEFGADSTMIAYGADIPPAADVGRLDKWRLRPGQYYLVVGRLVPDNNADLVVREFLASGSPRKLVVVGDDPYGGGFSRRLLSRLNSRLVFTGRVTDPQDLSALYQHCQAYIHGHEFGGTNPALLQAMASGAAACVLDTHFSRETLAGGGCGLFFTKEPGSLAQRITEIEAGGAPLEQLRQKARERIRDNYTWEDVIAKYRRLFAVIKGDERDALPRGAAGLPRAGREPAAFPLGKASSRMLKRGLDLALALPSFAFVLSWLWPLIALLIKLTSPGPVLFRQERWSRGGRPFVCYKFRSMVRESNDVDENHRYLQATQNDWRVTPVGRFLRPRNLDELAQFFNVLKGDMSIVGPRPHPTPMNLEAQETIRDYPRRHLVKPGITGWAQVNGLRGETRDVETLRRRVEADIWYIENWSFGLDLKIIWNSILAMLKGDANAY